MLTKRAQAAIGLLHDRARKTSDSFELERIDRALNEIIRLNGDGPPAFQVRSAMSHAGRVLKDRAELAESSSLDYLDPDQEPGAADPQFAVVDLAVWLQTTPALGSAQRRLLFQLAAEEEIDQIAAKFGVTCKSMRERISRTRRTARLSYETEVTAA
jgi:hypothetical protein